MRMTITIDSTSADWLADTLHDGMADQPSDEKRVAMQQTLDEVESVMKFMEMASRATKIYEDVLITVYENPDRGDEVPLMIYDKNERRGWVETPFWDASDPRELREWVRAEP